MLVCALREICVPPPTPAPWKTSWTPAALCEQPWVRLQQGQIMQIKLLVWQHWFINYSNRVCCCSIQCTQKSLIRTALLFYMSLSTVQTSLTTHLKIQMVWLSMRVWLYYVCWWFLLRLDGGPSRIWTIPSSWCMLWAKGFIMSRYVLEKEKKSSISNLLERVFKMGSAFSLEFVALN